MAFSGHTADVDIGEFSNDCCLDFDSIESDGNSDFNRLESYLRGSDESDNELDVCSPSDAESGTKTHKSSPNMAFYQSCPSGREKASSLDTVVVVAAGNHSSNTSSERCMTKPAILARERRKKHKEYLQQLETTVKNLQQENEVLSKRLETEVGNRDKVICRLSDEVKYLRSVLANDSSLSALLTNVVNAQGLTFRGSLMKGKSQSSPDNCRENSTAVTPELRSHGTRDGVQAQRSVKRSRTDVQDENCDPVPSPNKISRRSVNSSGNSSSPAEVEVAAEELMTTSSVHSSVSSSILVPKETGSSVSSQDVEEMSEGNAAVKILVHLRTPRT